MVDPVDPIVEALRAERERRKWSRRYVAQQMGCKGEHGNTIQQWEYGTRSPGLAGIKAYAALLGFDLVLKERG